MFRELRETGEQVCGPRPLGGRGCLPERKSEVAGTVGKVRREERRSFVRSFERSVLTTLSGVMSSTTYFSPNT